MSIDPPDFTCEIHIRASFGGVEAHYFAAMLLRMYVRWAERDGLRYEVGEVDGDVAGEVAQLPGGHRALERDHVDEPQREGRNEEDK